MEYSVATGLDLTATMQVCSDDGLFDMHIVDLYPIKL